MAKNILYYGFIDVGPFTGTLIEPVVGTETATTGSLNQPGDMIKLSAGSDAWTQDPQTITNFLSNDIKISSMTGQDWTLIEKENWTNSYLKYIGLKDLISSVYYSTIFNLLEQDDIFQKLSGACISYVTQNTETNEISIGCPVYRYDIIIEYANTLPLGDSLRNIIFSNHIVTIPYISNVFKTEYNSYEQITYCFDGIEYKQYNISGISIPPSIINGGGNRISEVKLAGYGITPHYIVKKDVDPNDPTIGLCSGTGKPFCMGDTIVVVDTSTWTENNGTEWTWIGDYTQISNTWHIADITNPCTDYSDVEIFDMLFPMRVIQFCEFQLFE